MGGSKKTTIGYHYRVAFHDGLCKGPIDAILEFRAADKTAWAGYLTESGRIHIDAPVLFGGEKDQGGISGDMDVMFGAHDQLPNDYLTAVFGPQQPAWHGLATLVFRGGRYGAMNPYPPKRAYLVRKTMAGWDEPGCWYPEKAEITHVTFAAAARPWRYLVVPNYDVENRSAPGYDDSAWSLGYAPFASSPWDFPGNYGFSTSPATVVPDGNKVWMRTTLALTSDLTGTRFQAYVDNDCRLYINGALAVTVGGNNGAYYNVAIPDGLLRAGENHVAAEGWDRHAGPGNWFWFDWRIQSSVDIAGMNPAHILYYSRTNAEMGREPRERIHAASLTAAADWFYAQGFGLCTRYDPANETPVDFEQRICKVAGCSFTRSLADGRWYLDIANGEYDLASLPVLTDDDILDFREVPSLLDEAANSISVKYFDVARKESITTAPVIAQGLVATFGTIHQTLDFPEIPTAALALRVAQRELLARVTPTRAFELTTTRKPRSWRPSQYFRLQCPRRGIADMVCIVGELQSGATKSGAIRLKAAQDVYSLPATVYVQPEPGFDPSPSQVPVPIATQRVDEAPYIALVATLSRPELQALPDDAGYLAAAAIDPARSRDYTLSVTAAGGTAAEVAFGDWTPSALIVEAAAYLDTAFTLTGSTGLDQVTPGMSALWDDEIVRVDAIDPAAGTITLARGCADTVPTPHAAGSRLWFPAVAVASDPTEYTEGETVTARLLTNTASQQLPESSATALPLTFSARQARPYPPANVQINGMAYPGLDTPITSALTLTWAHRDRVMQADQLVNVAAASIGPEPGTTYSVEYYADHGTAPVDTETGIAGTASTAWMPPRAGRYRIEMFSMRDALESWQRYVHVCMYGAEITGTVHGAANLESYSAQLAMNGTAPIMWSIATGSLPAGLHLNASTGEISGVPNDATGYYTATVRAEDAAGNVASMEIEIGLGSYSYLLHFDGANGSTTFSDATGKTWSRSGSNAIITTAQQVSSELGSVFQTSAGSYIYRGSEPENNLSTADFTLEVWARKTGADTYATLLGKRSSGGDYDWMIRHYNADDKPFFYIGTNAGNQGGLYAPVAVPKNTWYHFAVSRRGQTLRGWLNGAYIGEKTFIGNIRNSPTLVIGDSPGSYGDDNFAGELDEFRLIKGGVQYWDGDFTPPTIPYSYPQAAAPIAIKGALPAGTAGTAYNNTTSITVHGTGPFTIQVTAGSLPTGWNAVVNGNYIEVSGPAVPAGHYTFVLTASDDTHSASLPLTVYIGP